MLGHLQMLWPKGGGGGGGGGGVPGIERAWRNIVSILKSVNDLCVPIETLIFFMDDHKLY